jgi:hypothetical protein
VFREPEQVLICGDVRIPDLLVDWLIDHNMSPVCIVAIPA